MPNIEINGLPSNQNPQSTDLFASKKGSSDQSMSLDQITEHVKGNISDLERLTSVKNVDGVGSGLDADLWRGLSPSFFQNASNLLTGAIAPSLLPSGDFDTYYTPGGAYSNEGMLRCVLKLPQSLLGERLMVQFGHSFFIGAGRNGTVNFPEAFASGFTNTNSPWVLVSPESRSQSWNGSFGDPSGHPNIELEARLWYKDRTRFSFSTLRNTGSGNDVARANYIAIGRY